MNKKDKEIKSLLSTMMGEQPQQEPQPRPELRAEAPEIILQDEATGEELQPATPKEEDELLESIEDEKLREALRQKRLRGRGRPRKNDQNGKRPDGYARFTLVASAEKMAKLKEIAFRNTLTQKEVFEEALNLLIEKYEATHGEVIPEPEKYRGNVKKLFD